MHTAYKELGFSIGDYPNAYAHFAHEISLPLHTRLTDAEADYVIENFVEVLKEYLK
jgi:dTDP-4-amino-4,6-dideoxygalactose transaminase